MDYKQAMAERHTVRKFMDREIEADKADQIEKLIGQLNEQFGLSMELRLNDETAFNALLKLTFAKKARNYIILACPDTKADREKLGYASSELMMAVQTMGLNSWWIGGTFSRGKVSSTIDSGKVIGILVIGYGAVQGKPHKSKSYSDVSKYEGSDSPASAPEWFRAGVQAALMAPTAINRQAFQIRGSGDKVKITYAEGTFSGEDLGIVKHHFELGAGRYNFEWDI